MKPTNRLSRILLHPLAMRELLGSEFEEFIGAMSIPKARSLIGGSAAKIQAIGTWLLRPLMTLGTEPGSPSQERTGFLFLGLLLGAWLSCGGRSAEGPPRIWS